MTIIPIRSLMVIVGFGLGFAAATRAEPLPAPPAPPAPAAPLKLMRVAFTDLSNVTSDSSTLYKDTFRRLESGALSTEYLSLVLL